MNHETQGHAGVNGIMNANTVNSTQFKSCVSVWIEKVLNHNGKVEESHRVYFSRFTQNVYVFLSVSGHQQPVQLAEGGPAAALGSGRPQTGSLHRVRGGRAGAAGVRFRTGRPLAGLHLVSPYFMV